MNINDIAGMEIYLASPEEIRRMTVPEHLWRRAYTQRQKEELIKSREVTKPDTINYRTLRPEPGGLFCERIFGPVSDFECGCGRNHRGTSRVFTICPNCGVEITWSRVRRERMGYIELAAPVAHPLYVYGNSSAIAHLLGVSPRSLEPVIRYLSYIVLDPGTANVKRGEVLDELRYRALLREGHNVKVGIGAEALLSMLEEIDLVELRKQLWQEYESATSGQQLHRLARRLQVVEAMLRSGTQPTSLILRVLPVIPPDLRPMIRLDGGRFATADLNELYRSVIIRNNRLKYLLEIAAPDVITRNEKRLLQEAVDALFMNSRKERPVTGNSRRVLKSLTDYVSGKQGRFRQNLLGKRVDYSGRSVIVVGPHLAMDEVGLPKEIALELFKPMVARELVQGGYARNRQAAKKQIEAQEAHVWDVLEQVVAEHPVLLNRAPTLHRPSIQAFRPVLVEGRAIQLHPLVCAAFNADFDGDQMAVHVPLSSAAQAEALLLMLAPENLLDPKNGRPIAKPDKDMVIGIYYLTLSRRNAKGAGSVFNDPSEALYAHLTEHIHLNAPIWVRVDNLGKALPDGAEGKYLLTTVGTLLFNRLLPEKMPFINGAERLDGVKAEDLATLQETREIKKPLPKPLTSKHVQQLVATCIERFGMRETARVLDELKKHGFHYATLWGFSFGLGDLNTPELKATLLAEGEQRVQEIYRKQENGEISPREASEAVLAVWEDINQRLTKAVLESLGDEHPLRVMLTSGARANPTQVRQLVGWRGIMADPSGRPIELPIRSSFREGLKVLEYFISTHGARKGQADTALKTADSGYLTRRLVDVAQDVIITEEDCGTTDYILATERRDQDGNLIVPLEDVIVGRVLADDVAKDGQLLYPKGTPITRDIATRLAATHPVVPVRSPLTCKAEYGLCRQCYGIDLARGRLVDAGLAVGVIAAQSIGEPGTQLTMRTFHTGGVAGGDITQGLPRVEELLEARNPKHRAVLAQTDGRCEITEKDGMKVVIVRPSQPNVDPVEYVIPYGHKIRVQEGQEVRAGDPLTDGAFNLRELLRLKGQRETENYIVTEVQKVYREQGVIIHDKHIEIMVRQMLSKVRVVHPGDTDLMLGSIQNRLLVDKANQALPEGARPAQYEQLILGITKVALATDSFLSAASFQHTVRVLSEAALMRSRDDLRGLKENVIIGHKIPAGTGFADYRRVYEKRMQQQGAKGGKQSA